MNAPLPRAPAAATAASDVEKHHAIQQGQLALVDGREEVSPHPQLPVELEVGHRHGAARKKRRPGRPGSERDEDSRRKLDDAAKPYLRPHRGLRLGEDAEYFLNAVEAEHQSRD